MEKHRIGFKIELPSNPVRIVDVVFRTIEARCNEVAVWSGKDTLAIQYPDHRIQWISSCLAKFANQDDETKTRQLYMEAQGVDSHTHRFVEQPKAARPGRLSQYRSGERTERCACGESRTIDTSD